MRTSIQSYFALPVVIAAAGLMTSASALAQGGAPGGGGGAAGGGAAGIQAFLNAFGGAAGGAGGGAGGGARGGNGAFQSASIVTVVADTTGNNLVITAPEEIMKQIEALVDELDVPSDDATQIRAFFLKNSNPTEIVTLITSLFPDPNQSNTGRGNAGRGAGFAGGGGGGGTAVGGTSARTLRMQKVLAVAEPRTSSVIVSASTQMMGEIARVIDEIDSNPREAQEVAVLKLKGDVSNVQTVLQGLFGRTTTTQNQNNNPLVNRTQFLNGGGATGVTGTGTAARGAQ